MISEVSIRLFIAQITDQELERLNLLTTTELEIRKRRTQNTRTQLDMIAELLHAKHRNQGKKPLTEAELLSTLSKNGFSDQTEQERIIKALEQTGRLRRQGFCDWLPTPFSG